MNKQLSKLSLVIPTILLFFVISCSTNYTVSTNIDSNNFEEYFSPAKVTIYQSEQDFVSYYKFIGLVEGEDCQLAAHLAAPDEINARTNARRQAYQQKANAIIFTGCAVIDAENVMPDPIKKQCLSTVVCYGKAYQVDNSEVNVSL